MALFTFCSTQQRTVIRQPYCFECKQNYRDCSQRTHIHSHHAHHTHRYTHERNSIIVCSPWIDISHSYVQVVPQFSYQNGVKNVISIASWSKWKSNKNNLILVLMRIQNQNVFVQSSIMLCNSKLLVTTCENINDPLVEYRVPKFVLFVFLSFFIIMFFFLFYSVHFVLFIASHQDNIILQLWEVVIEKDRDSDNKFECIYSTFWTLVIADIQFQRSK